MAAEKWAPISGFEGRYEVSSLGRVRSLPRRRSKGGYLKPWLRSGYETVDIARRLSLVHRLVAEAFLPPRLPGQSVVRHINGDRLDNRSVNLAWGTQSDNELDKIAHGTNPQLRRTHCPQGHPYDDSNTYYFRGYRQCRACHAEKDRAPWTCQVCGSTMRTNSRSRHMKTIHPCPTRRACDQIRAELGGGQ